jgi:RNA polymerase sigma factor (sigma-70 family)
VERSDNNVRSGDDGIAIASSRFPTSAALVAAIRRGESVAIRELFILYAPLLRDQARLMSIDRGDEETVVTTLLDDIVIHLIENPITPRDLARYLVTSLRNRARNLHRDARRRQLSFDQAYSEIGAAHQLVVAESQSEYALRSSSSHLEETPIRTAIAKLAEKSAAALGEEDLRMMVAVGRHMPLREFAEQNGMSYANARVRLHRLRAKMEKLTAQYMALLEPQERREVERFLRRAGVRIDHGVPENHKGTRTQYGHPEKSNGHA